ncbi:hypothetical protein [Janibacter sp. HTCC2649]|uniref:VgrG-related protein n=1 Tax=Janibacter sp. HTCC2649 TaxID=313589 RepID=UPI0011D1B8EC|nr:hypothetical protein [Janibacter sp. HTCC2649]
MSETTATFLGADTEALRRLRTQLDTVGEQLRRQGATTTQQLQSLGWAGRDQQTFLDSWSGHYHPALLRAADALTTAAGTIEGQAADQDRVSGGPGGAGSTTGAAASTAATGALGAAAAGTEQTGAAGTQTAGGDLGSLSRRYESNGDPGTVSQGRGDRGGVSYGTYQLSSTMGSAGEFRTWLRREHPDLGARLGNAAPGSAAFSQAWRNIAATDGAQWGQIQHDYIQYSHYDPQVAAVERALPGINLEGRDPVVRDVLWSTAVQHRNATDNIFTRAVAGRDVTTMSDADLVRAVYGERGRDNGAAYFSRSSVAWQLGNARRFREEQAEALSRLGP